MISVVIPAYNEEKYISLCLKSLLGQQTTREFEVIVVDNNSKDKTAVVAKSYCHQLRLALVSCKKKGRGAARAVGFKKAGGEIIFSTDADTVLPADWLERIAAEFQDKQVVAVTGSAKINDCGWLTNQIYNLIEPITVSCFRLFLGGYLLAGFNFAVLRKTYLQSTGFDPSINGMEDVDLSFKIARLGKVKFLRDVKVIVSGRRFKNGFLIGSWPYLTNFLKFLIKKENVYLKEVK